MDPGELLIDPSNIIKIIFSLDSLPIASLSSKLSDGILLCQLVNSFHPAVCTSIAFPEKNVRLIFDLSFIHPSLYRLRYRVWNARRTSRHFWMRVWNWKWSVDDSKEITVEYGIRWILIRIQKPLVSCEDILGRRNLPSLARMVYSLSKTTANLRVSHL